MPLSGYGSGRRGTRGSAASRRPSVSPVLRQSSPVRQGRSDPGEERLAPCLPAGRAHSRMSPGGERTDDRSCAAGWRPPLCSRCREADHGLLACLVWANPLVVSPSQVAVEAEHLEVGGEAPPDYVQVEHDAAADSLAMGCSAAIDVVDGQEAAIGLSTAGTARTVAIERLVLQALVISPPLATNSLGVSRHLLGVASSCLRAEFLLVADVVVLVVLSPRHGATVLDNSLCNSQLTSQFSRVGSRLGLEWLRRRGRNRTLVTGFGDQRSTPELRTYVQLSLTREPPAVLRGRLLVRFLIGPLPRQPLPRPLLGDGAVAMPP